MAVASRGNTLQAKIKGSLLIGRIQNHALGKEDMTPTQLDAAKFLLNKILGNAPYEVIFPNMGNNITRVELVPFGMKEDDGSDLY